MSMTLEKFIESEEDRLAEFKESWERDNAINSEHYPMSMTEGEWDQQLLSYKPVKGIEDIMWKKYHRKSNKVIDGVSADLEKVKSEATGAFREGAVAVLSQCLLAVCYGMPLKEFFEAYELSLKATEFCIGELYALGTIYKLGNSLDEN